MDYTAKPKLATSVTLSAALLFSACSQNNGDDNDADGVIIRFDNCPESFNPEQADRDGDGIGDVCDDTPDGIQTPNSSPIPTLTPSPTATPVATMIPTPSPNTTPAVTLAPTPSPATSPSPSPTVVPTPTTNPTPTTSSTPAPTASPTPTPTTDNRLLVSHIPPAFSVTTADDYSGTGTYFGSMSASGERVLFVSNASDLVAGFVDNNGNETFGSNADLYLYDQANGEVKLVTHAFGSANSGSDVGFPPRLNLTNASAISADGRYIVFQSQATNLLASPPGNQTSGTTSFGNLYLYEIASDQLTLINHVPGSATTAADGFVQPAAFTNAISADGRFVVYLSNADLDANANEDGSYQAYLFDRNSGENTLVSHRFDDTSSPGEDEAQSVAISANGRRVVVASLATDLVTSGTSSGQRNVFVYDLLDDSVKLASRRNGTAIEGNDRSTLGIADIISADGSAVYFLSDASDLRGSDLNDNPDLFRFDYDSESVDIVTHAAGDTETTANGNVYGLGLHMSGDGRYAVYNADSTNLVAGQIDSNGEDDTFLYDNQSKNNVLLSHVAGNPVEAGDDRSLLRRDISADGRYVAFDSNASNLTANPTSGVFNNVYRYEVASGSNTLISSDVADPSMEAPAGGSGPLLSSSGSMMALDSISSQLIAGQDDNNSNQDVFLFPLNIASTTKRGDGDQLSDAIEFAYGLNPGNPDTDGDGLLDHQEIALGTQAARADSDSDGVSDFDELNRDGDPLNYRPEAGDSNPNDPNSR